MGFFYLFIFFQEHKHIPYQIVFHQSFFLFVFCFCFFFICFFFHFFKNPRNLLNCANVAVTLVAESQRERIFFVSLTQERRQPNHRKFVSLLVGSRLFHGQHSILSPSERAGSSHCLKSIFLFVLKFLESLKFSLVFIYKGFYVVL